jgi:hypothetical protein
LKKKENEALIEGEANRPDRSEMRVRLIISKNDNDNENENDNNNHKNAK